MRIIITTDNHSKFLRTEAIAKAIEYEERFMKDRKEGRNNLMLFIKEGTQSTYNIVVYHTKTSIIVNVWLQQTTS